MMCETCGRATGRLQSDIGDCVRCYGEKIESGFYDNELGGAGMKVKVTGCSQADAWYAEKVGEEFEVVRDNFAFEPTEPKYEVRLKRPYVGYFYILKKDCEIVQEQTVQNSKRPLISEQVIVGITAIIDNQDRKGFEKYGKSIDEANDSDHDWRIEALEEMADYSKYLVREIKRLEKENALWKEFATRLHDQLGETIERIKEGDPT